MKFTVEIKPLREAVAAASAVIKTRNVIPVLACVRIEAKDSRLSVSATDLDTWVTATCDAAVTIPGVAVVDANLLSRWLAAAGGLIHAEAGESLSLTSGRLSLTLPTHDAADFPEALTATGAEIVGGIDALTLCEPFASKEEARPNLRGVCFGAKAVATTGYIMCVAEASEASGLIIPTEAVATIRKAKATRIFDCGHMWRAEGEGLAMVGKCLDYVFPDWQRAIDVQQDPLCEVDADVLLDAIQAATLGQAKWVLLSGAGGEISVKGENFLPGFTPVSSASVACDAQQGFTQLFSTGLLVTALTPMRGRVVSICAHGSMGLSFRAAGAPDTYAYSLRDHRNGLPEAQVAA